MASVSPPYMFFCLKRSYHWILPVLTAFLLAALLFPVGRAEAQSVRLLQDAAYYKELLPALRQAKKRIDIAIFLFKVNQKYPDNRPAMIAAELVRAARRGVSVQVLLERSKKDRKLNVANEYTASLLEKGGVTVRFDSPRRTFHGKVVIIDQHLVFLGSHNFTHAALTWNNELSVMMENRQMATHLLRTIFQGR